MNLQGKVKKQEYPAGAGTGSSSYIPQPMEGLHDTGPPPFLTKTYDIVEDPSTNRIVSWSRGNKSFIVWDPEAFSVSLLPKYFKHNNFSSFVRQLNTYGFRKVDPDRWEFANEGFLRGQKCLLKSIRRRRTPQPRASQQSLDPCVEVGWFGLDGEVDRLRRDKQVLMVELVKLRQQQQNTKACLQLMEQRLRRTETKQQQMMGFLARAMRNPNFVQQLVQQKDRRKEHEEEINKKRRRPIDQYPSNVDQVGEFGNVNGEVGPFVKVELQEFGDLSELDQFSELQAIDMHGPSGDQENLEEVHVEEFGEEQGGKSKDLEEGFWVGLLNEDVEREIGILGGDIEDGEGVDVLVERLGYLASRPN